MDLYDQHLHSCHSFDSQADPAANVESARANGLAGLTFTEHFDTHPDDWEDCTYDEEAYSATIDRLRSAHGDALFVGKGIEICYQPDRMDFILDFLSRHSFDLVMLSVHYFGASAVHRRENWADVDPVEGTRRYLDTVLDAVRFCERLHCTNGHVFDVLAHLDCVKRYTHRWFGTCEISRFRDSIDRILNGCLAADLVPEVNTSTLRRDLNEPMPAAETIARYAALGGTAVTVGSDAHRAEDIGADFDQALVAIRAGGIGQLAVFRERKRRLMTID